MPPSKKQTSWLNRYMQADREATQADKLDASGDFDGALDLYHRAGEKYLALGCLDEWTLNLLEASNCLRELGRLEEATAIIADVSTGKLRRIRRSTRCLALLARGYLHVQKDRDADAAACFREAISLANNGPRPLSVRLRGVALSSLGSVLAADVRCSAEAEECLRKAAELADLVTKKGNGEACVAIFCSYAKFLIDQGELTRGDVWVEKAIALSNKVELESDTLVRLAINRGKLLLTRGEYKAAVKQARTAASLAEDPQLRIRAEAQCQAFCFIAEALRVSAYTSDTYTFRFDSEGRVREVVPESNYSQNNWCEEASNWLRRAVALADDERQSVSRISRCYAYLELGMLLDVCQEEHAAKEWLSKAAVLANDSQRPLHPRLQLEIAQVMAVFAARTAGKMNWPDALRQLVDARDTLMAYLRYNRWPHRLKGLMRTQSDLFYWGITIAKVLWAQTGDATYLGECMRFIDAQKCVPICHALRELLALRTAPIDLASIWWPGPANWRALFWEPDRSQLNGDAGVATVRAVNATRARPIADDLLVELRRGERDERHYADDEPITLEEVGELLSNPSICILQYRFLGNDLAIFQINRDQRAEGVNFYVDGGQVPLIANARPGLQRLADDQRRHFEYLLSAKNRRTGQHLVNMPPEQLREEFDWTRELYAPLYRILDFERVFSEIGKDCSEVDLVLIPDGPLFELPVHAAYCEQDNRSLYEQARSVSYGLSLKTLYLQHRIEADARQTESGKPGLRGIVFANPAGENDTCNKRIPHAIREVYNLVGDAPENWRIFGERGTQRATSWNTDRWHPVGNLVWAIGHGGIMNDVIVLPDGLRVELARPAIKLCDGPLSDARMMHSGYDFRRAWLLHFSCCLLGQLVEEDESRQIEGFIASLALMGARRVCSAMWPLVDAAAAEFARHWMAALKKHVFFCEDRRPGAFAVALKEAITAFRNAERGQYDHEVFWAPYTLYGVP